MRSTNVTGVTLACVLAGLLAGCSALPATGPSTQQITSTGEGKALTDYVLVNLDQLTRLNFLKSWRQALAASGASA